MFYKTINYLYKKKFQGSFSVFSDPGTCMSQQKILQIWVSIQYFGSMI